MTIFRSIFRGFSGSFGGPGVTGAGRGVAEAGRGLPGVSKSRYESINFTHLGTQFERIF